MSQQDYPDPQEDSWEVEYAAHLERMMEKQYWDEMEAQYEESMKLAEEASRLVETIEEKEKMNKTNEIITSEQKLLRLPMGENNTNAATIGEYLGLLLSTLWLQREGFSGKRPFGYSDWDTPVYLAMGKAGLTTFSLDEDGYIDNFDDDEESKADEMILQAIRILYRG